MLGTERDVVMAALALGRSARANLIKQLTDSLIESEGAREQAWLDEIEDRVAAFESGKMEAVNGPELIQQLRQRRRR